MAEYYAKSVTWLLTFTIGHALGRAWVPVTEALDRMPGFREGVEVAYDRRVEADYRKIEAQREKEAEDGRRQADAQDSGGAVSGQ